LASWRRDADLYGNPTPIVWTPSGLFTVRAGRMRTWLTRWEGHNYTEARVLDLLHREGPMTGKTIAEALGLTWRKSSSFTGITLRRLLRAGKLTRTHQREGLYSLADGLEPIGMSPDIEEHGTDNDEESS
jgi:hypothetical protein